MAAVVASSPPFRPPSSAALASGAIPLRREDFPLLHSLLESPAYTQTITRNPSLVRRRPSAETSGDRTVSTKQHARKPSRSASGSVLSSAVGEIWAKVPKTQGAGSSVVGVAKTKRRLSAEPWDLVSCADIEELQDGLLGVVPRAVRKEKAGEVFAVSSTNFPPRRLPPIPSATQSLPSLPLRLPQPLPTTATPQHQAPRPAVQHSPRKLSHPPPVQPRKLSNHPYETGLPRPSQELHISTSFRQLRADGMSTSGFQTTVSQLKRMLSRTSRRRGGSKLSKSSVGPASNFSSRTSFADSRRSVLSAYSPTSPLDPHFEAEELVSTPISPAFPPPKLSTSSRLHYRRPPSPPPLPPAPSQSPHLPFHFLPASQPHRKPRPHLFLLRSVVRNGARSASSPSASSPNSPLPFRNFRPLPAARDPLTPRQAPDDLLRALRDGPENGDDGLAAERHTAKPSPPVVIPPLRPSVLRSQSDEHPASPPWEEEEACRAASLYSSYGSRWVAEEVCAPEAGYASRAATPIRMTPMGKRIDEEEEKRVWGKWKKWVRERQRE